MRKNKQFDEKQLYDRGKCFQASFFIALACTIISYIVTDLLEIKVSGYLPFIFCIWIPISVCTILLIVKNAYDGVNSDFGKIVSIILFICGIMIIISRVIIIIIDNGNFIDVEEVESFIASMIQAVCMVTIAVVYFIKKYRNKKSFDEED